MGNALSIPVEHLPGNPAGDTSDVPRDVQDKRLERSLELLKERFHGRRVDFAHAIGREPNYVSRMLSRGPNRKRIGEAMAREIERALHLPLHWLDGQPDEAQTPAPSSLVESLDLTLEAARFAKQLDELDEPVRSTVLALVHMLHAAQKRAAHDQVTHKRTGRAPVLDKAHEG